MGKRREKQRSLWCDAGSLAQSPGHPFYEKLSRLLLGEGFDSFVEEQCQTFFSEPCGRPSLPPGTYFRLLLIGYFEGISSDRGIAWRVADSITLRQFLGYELNESTPNHSTLSRTRRLLDVETHEAVFDWVATVLARKGLVRGRTLGIDGTTLEANAAMRSIVRRDTGEGYVEYLKGLAKEAGLDEPTREELARFDKKRKSKRTSNKDWENPHDPDSKVTKMKDGRTHLAYKAEHAVDMETGAIVGVTVQGADQGDTTTLGETLDEVSKVLESVIDDPDAASQLSDELFTELVADKGYHSNSILTQRAEAGMRTYICEPDRGRRKWKAKSKEQKVVYGNRRRIRGDRGRRLLRSRSEKLERSFAHCYTTGGLRRVHVRGMENVRKRLLIHTAAFNLGLVLRQQFGFGTPRGFQGLFFRLLAPWMAFQGLSRQFWAVLSAQGAFLRPGPQMVHHAMIGMG